MKIFDEFCYATSLNKTNHLFLQTEQDPGIKLVKAKAIIDGRSHEKIEEVMKVSGIKQGELNKIKDLVTVK